jgi:signal transduction histidine kinase
VSTDVLSLLKTVDPFSQLPPAELEALAGRVETVDLPAGHPLFRQGDEGDRAYVVLDGELEVTSAGPVHPLVLNISRRGDLLGETALLRGTRRNATVTARTDSVLVAVGPADLQAAVGPGAGALMRTMLDRWEGTTDHVLRGERMAQLGTLAAGIAHELNNPASAVRRSAETLEATIEDLTDAMVDAARTALGEEQAAVISGALAIVGAGPETDEGPLQRADRESAIRDSLERLGVEEAWRLAPDIVEAGLGAAQVEEMAPVLGDFLQPALRLVVSASAARRLASEIGWAAAHMSDIARDLSIYSRMGEAPIQDVDVAEGLTKTLSLVAHQLEDVNVVRQISDDLPPVPGSGSELNQVWTNLIVNAAQATGPGGTVTVRAYRRDDDVVVEIEDDGPGISPDDQARIFDAFFTTKPPGSGTGLGLSISQRIIAVDHGGDLQVESEPGRTVFWATIPISRPPEGPLG